MWVSEWTYFERTANRLDGLLANHLKTTGEYPSNEAELRAVLKANGVEFDSLRDPWGNGFYVTFTNTFSYGDRVVVRYDELQKKKTELQPVTRQISIISLRSRGADGMEKTSDDFTVAEFSRLTVEMSSHDQQPKPPDNAAMFSNMLGEIRGIVTDVQGAAIAGASLKLTRALTQLERQTTSDSSGNYQFRNLPQGTYQLECETPGFRKLVITDIRVLPATVTQVTATPDVGAVSEVVAVSASVPQFQTTQDASVATVMSSKQIANLPINARNAANLLALSPGTQAGKSELATPRLREHFQETLVWQPQLETDKQGRASLKFKMADNITTWKLAAVASTVDGQIGIAETEFKAFQPFFAEHDPPKVLTEGDEISLPVVLRNYLGKSLSVTTEMKPERWFTLLGAARQQTRVAAGDSANAVFDFRVTGSVANGKQRVTALSTAASDAIEKPVSVHPDGEELAQTVGGVFANDGKLNLTIPADAIKTSVRAELKIYPNLMAHALEGIEGILRRPYGCGEQTISSTYPNVMALRYLRQQDESAAALAAKARRYAQAGYERLLGYRAESGGFSYWGRGEADLALTAYAVRFLNDARDYVSVEDSTIAKARDWVIAQQQTDGRWKSQWYVSDEDFRRSSLTTAYMARVLAAEQKRLTKPDKKLSESLQRALTYLAARVEEIDEPYLIASFALAAFDAGQTSTATKAVAKLRQLSHDEAGTAYWNLESNTPFYGWGLAGRVETTALVVKALQRDRETAGRRDEGTERDALTDKGLLFLLRNKDRYGVWYSTQATINVLDAMISLYEAERVKTSAGGQAEIFVNGKPAGSVVIPPGEKLGNPLIVNLASAIGVGDNRVEIRRSGEATLATAQIVETHYAAWKDPAKEIIEPNKSSLLRLAVGYDKTQAKIGEEITCAVNAERIGHRGYGMLLGEIGLPPGADVDRASLELAMKNSGWELNQYDVLPDRIVVYLWPRAGGTKFSFKFKLRYGIRAQSAPSVLYDYYNPEARVVVAPTRFAVK
ncbi:MAG: alpha-2-macroglobulin family protein [Acidobacteriota bacterium]|nr:alpha-2-macroglobulin family protein [Acidobacteriota bacterium]